MKASVNPRYFCLTTQVPVNSFQERSPSRRVAHPQAMEMAFEESRLDEINQRKLRQAGTSRIQQRLDRAHRLHERLRDYQVSQAEGRKHHFREGASVEDAAVAVERLQRLDRSAGIAVFAVVIILNDKDGLSLAPREQFQTPRERHHRASGKLMGRRHDN